MKKKNNLFCHPRTFLSGIQNWLNAGCPTKAFGHDINLYACPILITVVMILLSLMISPVQAHEKRLVAQKFEFIVGFVHEPAFSQQLNGVDLHVLTMGKPVEGLEKTLKVTVSKKDEKQILDLGFRSKYKEVGRYSAYFLPTKPGTYIFHIHGQINGVTINETFESGHKFHDVEDVLPVTFP